MVDTGVCRRPGRERAHGQDGLCLRAREHVLELSTFPSADPEAAFRQAVEGKVDLVVAMYHDQGLAPLKALDFGRSVNWTLGLPLVRTSVDHGTADDIAWKGVADASSMMAAIALAEQLSTTDSKHEQPMRSAGS